MTIDSTRSAARTVAQVVARRLAEATGEFAVIGLGRSGVAAARLLRRAGLRVYASDRSSGEAVQQDAERLRAEGVDVDVGTHDLARIARAAVVVASPGRATLRAVEPRVTPACRWWAKWRSPATAARAALHRRHGHQWRDRPALIGHLLR